MKKHLLILFAALLPLVASSAEKVEIDGIWYNLVSKAKQAEVTYKGWGSSDYDEYSGSITIPATVTYEGVDYGVTSIGYDAFEYCHALTSINIPESVTSIGRYAFNDCRSLTAINISEGVTSIEAYAFFDCRSLTSITLPESVTGIEECAFMRCSSLTSVTVLAMTPPIAEIHSFNNYSIATLFVPQEAVNDYQNTSPWNEFETIQGFYP